MGSNQERHILEGAIRRVAEQAVKADELIGEAMAAGFGESGPLIIQAKTLRLELLQVKADLERELGQLVLSCSACGRDVHWVSGIGVSAGHWGHREAAPHGNPVV
jgi:hypothetical protein